MPTILAVREMVGTLPPSLVELRRTSRFAHPTSGLQITSDFPKPRQAPESKIFRFRSHPNQSHNFAHPPRQEGRIAIVTDAGLDAVDAAASGANVVAGRVLP